MHLHGRGAADSFRRGSLRLGVRVTPYPDNRYCVDAVPAFLPEGSDCDFVWLPNVLDSGALGEQRAGRVNRVSRAAYNLTEFRRSLEEAFDGEGACDQVLVLLSGHVQVIAGNGRATVQAKSPWGVLNAAVADSCSNDAPPLAAADAEAGVHWQTLLASASSPFVGAAQTPSVTFEPTAAKPWRFLVAEFVTSLLVSIQHERLTQDYLEGLRRLIDGVVDVLCLVLVMVLAAPRSCSATVWAAP